MCRGASDSITCRILRRRFSCKAEVNSAGFAGLISAAAFADTPLAGEGLPPFFLAGEQNAHIETPFTILFQGPTALGRSEKLDFVNSRACSKLPRPRAPPPHARRRPLPVLCVNALLFIPGGKCRCRLVPLIAANARNRACDAWQQALLLCCNRRTAT